jgi:predicted nucleotidyltransferase
MATGMTFVARPVRDKISSMTRTEAVGQLSVRADALRAMGATALYLFGSTARNEASEASDLDLFIDYDRQAKFSLLDLVGIKLFLEDELQVPVDVMTRDGLHPLLSEDIQQAAIRVF